MNKGLLSRLIIAGVSTIALASSITALSLSWFMVPGGSTDKETLDGMVGLRSYFYDGNGTEDKPFEIVSPIHFYNLTRLQNLGVFSLEKTYFRIGHVFDENIGPQCINTIGNETTYDQYLDMSEFCLTNKLLPIGGEGAPFIGEFNGDGIPIKNLKVAGYPEDIGVFGYVSYGGVVDGLVCENLEIYSLGYTQTPADTSTELFGQNIDDIFTENAQNFLTLTSVNFVDYNSVDIVHNIKHVNGLGGYSVAECNKIENLVSSDSTIYNGYFDLNFPNVENDPFTYSWRSSSDIIKSASMETVGGTIKEVPVIDFEPLINSSSNPDDHGFNCGEQMQVDARLSLIASVEIGGFTYSRVIQTYQIEFLSNGKLPTDYAYEFHIYCDYMDQYGNYATNYHHGNNIGFLAGHVDGSITNSYVYKGKLFLNNSEGCHEILSESETGLVGEIGTNVVNSMDPDYGLTEHGDTGIINFTKIYNNIRSDVVKNDVVKAGTHEFYDSIAGIVVNKHILSYDRYKNTDTKTYNLFKPYLRHYTDAAETVITGVNSPSGAPINNGNYGSGNIQWHDYTMTNTDNSFNSVDFLWNSVIEDRLDLKEDRGLGVFKIVANYMNTSAPGFDFSDHYLDGLGDCTIQNGSPKTKVYFSTAEYDATATNLKDSFEPFRATTLPSYFDEKSFQYPFSRDYNYCFQLDLAQMANSFGKNYMYNTDSEFLAGYLESILIDKYGGTIKPQNPKFGFMFRNSEYEPMTSLSSYMPLDTPGNKKQFGTDAENHPLYYPTKSIVFTIDNEHGANVSVIASNNDVGIWSFNPLSSSNDKSLMYRMKSSATSGNDPMRYFTYDLTDGETSGHTTDEVEINEEMSDSGHLYAHIFKLPKGTYALGGYNGKANVYFLCVQGQTEANIGDKTQAAVGNAITDVDFLLEPATYADFHSADKVDLLPKLAEFSFKSNYNLLRGKMFEVDVKTVNDKKYLNLIFEDDPRFVTYLLLLSRTTEHTYYLNNVLYNEATYVHIQS